MQKLISPGDLIASRDCQIRAKMNDEVIEDYAELYKAKTVFPPLHVFTANGKAPYLIADGFHRHAAAHKVGMKLILCEIYTGNATDCLRFALGTNATHGLRRTNADKHRAVELALKEWPRLSSRGIAAICGVSDVMVGEVRKLNETKSEEEEKLRCKRNAPEEKGEKDAEPVEDQPATVDDGARLGKDGKWQKPKRAVAKQTVPPKDSAPKPPKADKQWIDRIGIPIPEPAREVWDRRDDAELTLAQLDKFTETLKEAQKRNDILFTEVMFSAVFSDIEKIRANVATAIPHTVCPTCQGQVANNCTLCSGRGMISKFRYETVVPKELRKMREQSIKK